MFVVSCALAVLAVLALVISCFTKVCNITPPNGTKIEDSQPSTRANFRCLPDGGCHVDFDLTISWRRRWTTAAAGLTVASVLCLLATAFMMLWN
jgi:hypothetical protein